ncbi:hypothetical protein Tco_1291546 [Tanacetum coccineum]
MLATEIANAKASSIPVNSQGIRLAGSPSFLVGEVLRSDEFGHQNKSIRKANLETTSLEDFIEILSNCFIAYYCSFHYHRLEGYGRETEGLVFWGHWSIQQGRHQWELKTGVVIVQDLRRLDGCGTIVSKKGALGPLSPLGYMSSLLKK